MWLLCNIEILRALGFKSSYAFLKRPPGYWKSVSSFFTDITIKSYFIVVITIKSCFIVVITIKSCFIVVITIKSYFIVVNTSIGDILLPKATLFELQISVFWKGHFGSPIAYLPGCLCP